MKISSIASISFAVSALLAGNAAHADTSLLSDGDFETFASQVATGTYTTINAGQTLGAWTVNGASVDLIRNAYGAINDVSVDLAGTPGPGYITQSFNAVAGTTYTLSWDYFKNGEGTALDVSFGGATTSYAPPAAATHASLSWTATTSGLQAVTFGTASNGNAGPVLDNVSLTSVSAVPEPQSGALLLAGLGCMGWLVRRRQR